ncbi:hypothetical protein AB0H73_22620 [Streptomyces olivoreticuli]
MPNRPWVGDEVRDERTGRAAIITDVRRKKLYVLRPVAGTGEWTAEDPEQLTLVRSRQHRHTW